MNIRILVAIAIALCITASGQAASQQVRSVVEPRTAADTASLPFSGAVQVGDTLYLSGHIGIDANRQLPDTAEGEARAVLDALQKTLERAGMTMDDLVYVQVFCSDVANYDDFNKVYRGYFAREFPARAFVGSGRLLFGARFEVQGIAVKR